MLTRTVVNAKGQGWMTLATIDKFKILAHHQMEVKSFKWGDNDYDNDCDYDCGVPIIIIISIIIVISLPTIGIENHPMLGMSGTF